MTGNRIGLARWMFILVGLIFISLSLTHAKEKTRNDLWFEAVRYNTPGKYEKIKFLLDEGFDVKTTDEMVTQIYI